MNFLIRQYTKMIRDEKILANIFKTLLPYHTQTHKNKKKWNVVYNLI